jgi:pimeloyl-ACP methyl ester carboxylesterase
VGREVGAVVEQALLVARRLQRVPERPAEARGASPQRFVLVPDAGDRETTAVVFVHGFLAAGAVFDPMRREVERRLGLPTVDFTYAPTASFEQVAERLARVVARAAELVPRRSPGGDEHGPRVDLVGHSLGGLLARWYLQELGGARNVRRLVTLATPHGGTRTARIAPVALGRALRPDSDVVRRLKEGRHRAGAVRHVAIVAGGDLMVTPPESAAALEDAEVIWIDGLGHNEMLFDRRVHAHVVRALAGPAPRGGAAPHVPADSRTSTVSPLRRALGET